MSDQANCDHTFPEEREPSGRLILGPCMSCGMPALEAMAAIKAELEESLDHLYEAVDSQEIYLCPDEEECPHCSRIEAILRKYGRIK